MLLVETSTVSPELVKTLWLKFHVYMLKSVVEITDRLVVSRVLFKNDIQRLCMYDFNNSDFKKLHEISIDFYIFMY